MGLKEKIKALRKDKKITQKELAFRIGVAKHTVFFWESGRQEPNPVQRRKLCTILGITEAELFGAPVVTSELNISKIPVISWVHANKFEPISEPFTGDEYILTSKKCRTAFALRVVNDCMSPEFQEGDIIIVCPEKQVDNNDYAIIADRQNNTATFKQYKKYGDNIILHPLNPKFQDIILNHSEQYRIIGKVVEKIKKY